MTCQQFKRTYFAEAEGSAAAHLETCAACRDLLAAYEAGLAYLRAPVEAPPPPYLSPKIAHRLRVEADRCRRGLHLRIGLASACAALLLAVVARWDEPRLVAAKSVRPQESVAAPQAPAEVLEPLDQAPPAPASSRAQARAAAEPGAQGDQAATAPRKAVARRLVRSAKAKPRPMALTARPLAQGGGESLKPPEPASAWPSFWFVRVDLQSPAEDVRVLVVPGRGHEILAVGRGAAGAQEFHFVELGTYLVPLLSKGTEQDEAVTVEVVQQDGRHLLRVRPPKAPSPAPSAAEQGGAPATGEDPIAEGSVLAFLPGEGGELHAAEGVTVGRGLLEPRPITVANLKRTPNLAGKVELVMADERIDLSEFQVLPAQVP